MDIVARAKTIILTPKTEWPVIEAEPSSVEDIYRNYLVYVAAVPAVAGFIGSSIVGYSLPVIGTVRMGLVGGLVSAVISFALGLAGVYLLAVIVDKLAPTFNATPNFLNAFKLSAYSVTASWLAGIFLVLPSLSGLTILGLYSVYLFYVGLPILMKAPAEKTLPYTLAVGLSAIVIAVVITAIVSRLFPMF